MPSGPKCGTFHHFLPPSTPSLACMRPIFCRNPLQVLLEQKPSMRQSSACHPMRESLTRDILAGNIARLPQENSLLSSLAEYTAEIWQQHSPDPTEAGEIYVCWYQTAFDTTIANTVCPGGQNVAHFIKKIACLAVWQNIRLRFGSSNPLILQKQEKFMYVGIRQHLTQQ